MSSASGQESGKKGKKKLPLKVVAAPEIKKDTIEIISSKTFAKKNIYIYI